MDNSESTVVGPEHCPIHPTTARNALEADRLRFGPEAREIARALLLSPLGDRTPEGVRFETELRLGRRLGAGSMGVVHEAVASNPSRTVAVKLLRPEFATHQAVRRLRFEAEVLSRLNHPNIARVLGFGVAASESEDLAYLVTELVEGAKPIVEFSSEGCPDLSCRVDVFLAAAEAVAYAHEKGVIHRDLKPANILVDSAGIPRVIDFGLAKVASPDWTASAIPSDRTGWLGTARYLAPELLQSGAEADTRSDVFALGLVLSEIIAATPCPGPSPVRTKARAHPSSRLRDLHRIVARATARDPSCRYSSARPLVDDINRWRAGLPPTGANVGIPEFLVTVGRRYWRPIALGALVLTLAVTLPASLVLARLASLAEADAIGLRHITAIAAASQAFNSGAMGAIPSLIDSPSTERDRLESLLLREAGRSERAAVRLDAAPTCVAFFGRNGLLLVGTRDNELKLFDPDTGAELWSLTLPGLPHKLDVDALGSLISVDLRCGKSLLIRARRPNWSVCLESDTSSLSPDGRLLASILDSELRLLSVDGRVVARLQGLVPTRQVSWSPFGDEIGFVLSEREAAVCSLADPGTFGVFMYRYGAVADVRWLDSPERRIALLDTNGPLVWRQGLVRAPNPAVRAGGAEAVATLAGSRLLATGGGLGRVTVGDYEQGPPLLDVVAHRGTVTALEISPDGRRVVSAGADGFVRVWDLDPAAEAARRDPLVPLGVRSRVGHVSERHPLVTLASEDGRIATIDVLSRREVFVWHAPDRDPTAVGGSPEQERFAVGFASGEVWYADRDGGTPFLLAAEPGQVCAVEWLDERRLAILWETGTLALVDASEGRRLWQTDFGAAGLRVSLAARRILRSGPDEIAVLVASDTVDAARCAIATGAIRSRMHGRGEGLLSDRAAGMALDADGSTLTVVASSGDAYRWPRRGPAAAHTVDPAPPPVALATATPDPQRLALLSRTGMLTLVDPRDGRAITTLSSVLRPIAAAGFTSHRDSLIVVGLDGMTRVLPTREAAEAEPTPMVVARDDERSLPD